MMLRGTQMMAGLLALGLATACDTGGRASVQDAAAEVAAALNFSSVEEANDTLKQVALIEGEFDAKSSSPECLALRAKVFAERQAFRASSEWQTVTATEQFKALENDGKRWKDDDCKNNGSTQPCQDLLHALNGDADALADTPQWQTLGNNDTWKSLLEDFGKGLQIGCF